MSTFRVDLLNFNLAKIPLITPTKSRFKLMSPSPPSSSKKIMHRSVKLAVTPKPNTISTAATGEVSLNDNSRMVIIAAVSVGIALFVMDGRAMALGPEGQEDFWDNMRRYGLYALTVSTGAIYALLEPIIELLKNPISAVLILIILGGGFYIVSQIVTAMVGLSDFSYELNY